MGWKQVKSFNLSKMGSQAGMCEKNVRLAFGLPAKCASAKEDMLYNKSKGALHPMDTLPKNVAVPVFVDTTSVYEHIEVSDRGTFYSDKKKLANPMNQKFFGWGEFVAKARVVEYVKDPVPPAPAGIKVGDKVLPTNWTDYNGRRLAKTRNFYFVKQISGDRVVLTADSVNGTVYCAIKKSNLKKV